MIAQNDSLIASNKLVISKLETISSQIEKANLDSNAGFEKVVNTLNALKAGGTAVAGVVIDDVDFSKVKEADLQTVASYAKATKTKIWFSSTSAGDKLEDSAPNALLPYFSAVIHLSSKNSVTQLSILKMGKNTDIETTLKLDSKTLLITHNK